MKSTATADPSTAAPVDQQSTVPETKHAERRTIETTRSTTQSVCCLDLLGADVNYLVGVLMATHVIICGAVKLLVYTKKLRIS